MDQRQKAQLDPISPLPIPDVAPSLCRRPHSQDVHIPTVDPESAGGEGVTEFLIGLGPIDDCDQAEVVRVVQGHPTGRPGVKSMSSHVMIFVS